MTKRTFIDEIEDKYDLESKLNVYLRFFTEEDVTKNYLVFQAMYRYFKPIADFSNGSYIYY